MAAKHCNTHGPRIIEHLFLGHRDTLLPAALATGKFHDQLWNWVSWMDLLHHSIVVALHGNEYEYRGIVS